MKLDPRIKSVSDILTCFDTERAKEFIGKNGFFANEISLFTPGAPNCRYGALTNVLDDQGASPYLRGSRNCYSFFIPESSLMMPAEKKKWRPFTLDEFRAKFPLLSPVTFRRKENGELRTYSFVGYIASGGIILGNDWRRLENLFEDYELKGEDGNWTPFGVGE